MWSASIVVLTLATFPEAKASPYEASEKRAASAADAWVKFVDNGKYAESWETASELFKNQVEKASGPKRWLLFADR